MKLRFCLAMTKQNFVMVLNSQCTFEETIFKRIVFSARILSKKHVFKVKFSFVTVTAFVIYRYQATILILQFILALVKLLLHFCSIKLVLKVIEKFEI